MNRQRPLVTAALIVRDEEAFLGDCLASICDVVDEIVVVDTGSIDKTPEIARQYGARLFHHPWADDFAEARNVSLDMATGAWILYIDADERLSGMTREELASFLANADEVAFRLLLRPKVNTTPYREYRLWRNDPRIRFDGTIHEKVVPAIHRVGEEDGRPIGQIDLLLDHLGYEGDQTRKHYRNLPLLRRQLEVEPTNLFAWHHLFRVLEALGESAEAEAALQSGVQMARATNPNNTVACLLYVDLIASMRRRGDDATALMNEARSLFPDNCVLLWMASSSAIEDGRFREAITYLDEILATDWLVQRDWGPSYEQKFVEELPWATKALCHFRLSEYLEAAEAYEAALRCDPTSDVYKVKAKFARLRSQSQEQTFSISNSSENSLAMQS